MAHDVRRPAYQLGAVLRILYASHLNSKHATCSRFKTAGLSPLGISDKATPAPLKKHRAQVNRVASGLDRIHVVDSAMAMSMWTLYIDAVLPAAFQNEESFNRNP